jgi:hypothetical protein
MSRTDKPIEERAQDFYNAVFDPELLHLMDVAEGGKRPNRREREDGIRTEEDARERLEESGYGLGKEIVYYVTLAGGGPAARLRVVADEHGEVEDAVLQFQDWFEPWTDAPRQDAELVARYARLIGYYGEGCL